MCGAMRSWVIQLIGANARFGVWREQRGYVYSRLLSCCDSTRHNYLKLSTAKEKRNAKRSTVSSMLFREIPWRWFHNIQITHLLIDHIKNATDVIDEVFDSLFTVMWCQWTHVFFTYATLMMHPNTRLHFQLQTHNPAMLASHHDPPTICD